MRRLRAFSDKQREQRDEPHRRYTFAPKRLCRRFAASHTATSSTNLQRTYNPTKVCLPALDAERKSY